MITVKSWSDLAFEQNWHFLDLWDAIPPNEFTNSAVHLSTRGSQQFADKLWQAILDLVQFETSPED